MKKLIGAWLWIVLSAAIAGSIVASAACGGGEEPPTSGEDDITAAPTEVDTATDEPAQDTPAPDEGVTKLADTVAGTMAAIDLIDSAGFHDMAQDLAEATEINPRYASKVTNVLAATLVADWPEDIAGEVEAFAADLDALKTALEAEDLEGARAAGEAVHDTQHDLSVGAYAWLAGQSGALVSASTDIQAITSMAAVDIVDSAGFHDMAEDLAETTEINARYAGKVGNVITATTVAAWPDEAEEAVDALLADLEALKTALDAEDLEGARVASEAVHDSQHDFSVAVYSWLGSQPPMMHASEAMISSCNVKVQDMIDSAGFHDMAEELAEATEINPRYAGKVGNVLAVTKVAAWNPDVSAELSQFVADLEALKAALDAEDIEGARAASEAIHDSQHDLSHATFTWIGGMAGMMDAHGS